MKPYGLTSKRDLGTYEQSRNHIYCDGYSVRKCDIEVRRTKKRSERRRAREFIKKELENLPLMKCDHCNDVATWIHGNGWYCCDFHVPRDCSCNDDSCDPCCDWIECEEGWPNEQT